MTQTTNFNQLLTPLNKLQIKHRDIQPIMDYLKESTKVEVKVLGQSFEQRDIHLIKLGKGEINILAWTQMHGDEPTATSAVFDLINALCFDHNELPNTNLDDWEQYFSIYIIPMLNPDGAQRTTRQNAQSIDINRDALELQSPEGRVLMEAVKTIQPDIGFNLHDQSDYYQCGKTGNPTTIGFLAPSYDVEKSINDSRHKAMLLIDYMKQGIQDDIPNCIARYDDTFAIRCFGDNIAKLGVTTILIESGASIGDANRQVARRLNVKSMLYALEYLHPNLENRFEVSIDNYFEVPQNVDKAMTDVIYRNLNFEAANPANNYQASIVVRRISRFSKRFFIDFIGDATGIKGFVEHDSSEWRFVSGGTLFVDSPITITNELLKQYLQQGIISFYDPENQVINQTHYPLNLSSELPERSISLNELNPIDGEFSYRNMSELATAKLNQDAYWLLAEVDKHGRVIGAVLNGELWLF